MTLTKLPKIWYQITRQNDKISFNSDKKKIKDNLLSNKEDVWVAHKCCVKNILEIVDFITDSTKLLAKLYLKIDRLE
ncbi:hypothetical protein BpHYR1_054675, partial [Brachionus plicatilis]